MTDLVPVNRAATERLCRELLATVKCHYLDRSLSRETVFEVLNALAWASAITIAGARAAGDDAAAMQFFQLALAQNVDSLARGGG